MVRKNHSPDVLRALPVYRASLPRAERLLPYLQTIDANRWYTNRGELTTTFEARLADVLGTGSAKVITAASGTAAIEGAILAVAGRATAERPLAVLPSYTFVATAAAAECCGYTPYLFDVDAESWALDAVRLAGHPILRRTGVVVPVAPYGRGVAQADWVAFQEHTNVPVVIDAAAGFEALAADPGRGAGTIPVTLSFQATKAFSSGEGGAVVWSDTAGLQRVERALNFGILGKREITSSGTNGKMSEYHAAVGLGSLDEWAERCRVNRTVAQAYRRAASGYGVAERLFVGPDVASNYALLDAGSPNAADDVIAALQARNIESRRWYGCGLHREPYLRDLQHEPLPVTDRIAPSIVGLPIACDISPTDIDRTIATASRALASRESTPA